MRGEQELKSKVFGAPRVEHTEPQGHNAKRINEAVGISEAGMDELFEFMRKQGLQKLLKKLGDTEFFIAATSEDVVTLSKFAEDYLKQKFAEYSREDVFITAVLARHIRTSESIKALIIFCKRIRTVRT